MVKCVRCTHVYVEKHWKRRNLCRITTARLILDVCMMYGHDADRLKAAAITVNNRLLTLIYFASFLFE